MRGSPKGWLLSSLFALAGGAFIALTLLWMQVTASIPPYEGRFALEGLSRETTILRDRHAVPHIFAHSRADALFALGFAHAQERLWQMEITRRAAQGRLSEYFGAFSLPRDRYLRALGLHERAARSFNALDSETRALIAAYAAGVNAWIARVREGGHGRGAPEFLYFGGEISPWTAADSLSVVKMLALRLASGVGREVLYAQLRAAVGEDGMADLFPQQARARHASPADGFARAAFPAPEGGASNAWAVSAARTASGASILAADPHLGLTAPPVWMLARMDFGDGTRLIGATIPGIPAVVVGRNDSIAWGLTTANLDDMDLFIERFNPDDPALYATEKGWAPLEIRRETIHVRGGEPEMVALARTRHGPIIPLDFLPFPADLPEGEAVALSWTGLLETDTSIRAIMRLNVARSITDALKATRDHVAPAQNIILADSRRVAMATVGRAPRRHRKHETRGRAPARGWIAHNGWLGLADAESLPRIIDPPGGAVANANNRLWAGPFPHHLSHDWEEPYRINRINHLLDARKFHSLSSFRAMQADIVSGMARELLPLVAGTLERKGETQREGRAHGADARRARALALLGKWNSEMTHHDPEPLIFVTWMRELLGAILRDELGALASHYRWPQPLFVARVFRNEAGAGRWCDDITTAPRESCAAVAQGALDAALDRLESRYGKRIEGWHWGAEHVARHDNFLLGRIPLLGSLANARHEMNGGDFTLMRAAGAGSNLAASAGGFRMIVDFSDPDRSLYSLAMGQSGHPASDHYDDLLGTWRFGEYLSMSLAPREARLRNLGETTLVPSGEH